MKDMCVVGAKEESLGHSRHAGSKIGHVSGSYQIPAGHEFLTKTHSLA
jgi:hypothetical protein